MKNFESGHITKDGLKIYDSKGQYSVTNHIIINSRKGIDLLDGVRERVYEAFTNKIKNIEPKIRFLKKLNHRYEVALCKGFIIDGLDGFCKQNIFKKDFT